VPEQQSQEISYEEFVDIVTAAHVAHAAETAQVTQGTRVQRSKAQTFCGIVVILSLGVFVFILFKTFL
jgi:hypothetical protein